MDELTYRFPHAPEAILKELLMAVLECLRGALNRLVPLETTERTLKGLVKTMRGSRKVAPA